MLLIGFLKVISNQRKYFVVTQYPFKKPRNLKLLLPEEPKQSISKYNWSAQSNMIYK